MEPKTYEIVDSVEKLEEAILRTKEAQKIFATRTTDLRKTLHRIFRFLNELTHGNASTFQKRLRGSVFIL